MTRRGPRDWCCVRRVGAVLDCAPCDRRRAGRSTVSRGICSRGTPSTVAIYHGDGPGTRIAYLWYPLGYNIRPIRLHAIARETVARYGGRLPDREDALRQLPGVGRYTAGAILSFAYGQDTAVLDTNVRRVLGRVFLGPRRLARLRGDKRLWDLAAALVPRGRAYDFNQALMDFGATWCTPRKPRCASCPMKRFCASSGLA